MPWNAQACIATAPQPALAGYPTDGAAGVPTDAIPVFDMTRISLTSGAYASWTYTLETDDGATIALGPRQSAVWHFELVPASRLAPNTHYALRASPPSDQAGTLSISFSTGAGPLAEPPPPPVAMMQHYTIAGDAPVICGPSNHGTCLSFAPTGLVELFYLDLVNDPSIYAGTFGTQGPYLFAASLFDNLTGVDQGTPYQCVRFRTRAASGTFSAPTQLCGKDATTFDYPMGTTIACTATGLSPAGTPQTATGSGGASAPKLSGPSDGPPTCSAAGTSPSGRWTVFAFAAALVWLARRRPTAALSARSARSQ